MAIKLGGTNADDEMPDIVAEINITPLTDVFLVLLIIFMVTTSVMSQMGVDVDLPKAAPGTAHSQPEGVVVTLMQDGFVKVNDRVVNVSDKLRLKMTIETYLKQAANPLVILEGDRKAFLGSAVTVMDVARQAGAMKFAIATELEN